MYNFVVGCNETLKSSLSNDQASTLGTKVYWCIFIFDYFFNQVFQYLSKNYRDCNQLIFLPFLTKQQPSVLPEFLWKLFTHTHKNQKN